MLDIYRPKHIIHIKSSAEATYIATRWNRALRYGHDEFATAVFINADYVLLEYVLQNRSGDSRYVKVDFTEIFKRANAIGAKHVILIHNHPYSNYLQPSEEDIYWIAKARVMAREWNVQLTDSVITTCNYAYSMTTRNIFCISTLDSDFMYDISNNFKEFPVEDHSHVPPYETIRKHIANTFLERYRLKHGYDRKEKETAKPFEFPKNAKEFKSVLDLPPYIYKLNKGSINCAKIK